MEKDYTEGKTFKNDDFENSHPLKGEYEDCRFLDCDFSNGDLSDCIFVDCEFLGCNLSLAKLTTTTFRDAKFKECKMLGLRFDDCNPFGLAFSFEDCILNHSSLFGIKIKKTIFKNTQLQEVDFTASDLTGSLFDNCDLARATFERTVIEKADFRTSYNYSIDPENNRVRKAKFSVRGIAGLLEKYDLNIDTSF
ncbi:Pentapeptide repeat-containing protein [Mariniphaga anaerophila]|uniref:Pentapeptide repeat-containing protein n=1 Tax=Mariniphaga anaerophila TaxID=1484053 RepID=A0A1M5BGL4_9BACT|nr:pentapeptide repeat-containing protein [Mariniphaga anaerophila]SHF41362.1 Pentapeptide repeat-containing protein [Mariniphaga anaerophila]